jgi:acyl carrier protein
MTEETKKRIFAILQKEVRIDLGSIDPDSDFRDKINLDSMQFVTIIARLENELDIEIPISAMEAVTLNEFVGFLDAGIAVKSA